MLYYIERAINKARGLTNLARILNTSHQNIQSWRKYRVIPRKWVDPFVAIMDGEITRCDVRPDLYPPEAIADHQPADSAAETPPHAEY